MTGGSNQGGFNGGGSNGGSSNGGNSNGSGASGDGSNGSGSNGDRAPSRPLQPRDDRETLSALFDGELPGDAARFALKRLDHDIQWQDTCGRWQLIGDALRGEVLAVAPIEFAAGVSRALDQLPRLAVEIPANASVATSARAVSRARWLGGAALAASVALAAVLVVKPFSPSPPGAASPTLVRETLPPPLPPAPTQAPALAGGELSPVAAAVAAEAPNRVASVRPAPARSQPAPTRARRASAGPARPAGELPVATVAAATPAAPASGAFHPPADDVVTRPWPRAALPDAAAAGAFTVGLDGTSPSPSFYPFEPPAAPASQDDSDTLP